MGEKQRQPMDRGRDEHDDQNDDEHKDEEATVDVDSYAIIPAATLFTNVVPAVLRKLGYSDDVVFNATGTSH